MIPHHAQAVVMAKMARTHTTREDIRVLCERTLVAQSDEITFMRNWPRDRGQMVPPADATHHRHTSGRRDAHELFKFAPDIYADQITDSNSCRRCSTTVARWMRSAW